MKERGCISSICIVLASNEKVIPENGSQNIYGTDNIGSLANTTAMETWSSTIALIFDYLKDKGECKLGTHGL